jgi:hypothetical protein
VEHVPRRLYVNRLANDFSPRKLVDILRAGAYISLESALAEWGISTQSPSAFTSVTTGFPREFRSPSVQIVYRHIAKKLHWGFEAKRTRDGSYRIAEPEKGLLDWIYFQRQERLPTPFDELSPKAIDWEKLLRYSLKFPQSVRSALEAARVVVFEADIQVTERRGIPNCLGSIGSSVIRKSGPMKTPELIFISDTAN